jgi:hypothetical protein
MIASITPRGGDRIDHPSAVIPSIAPLCLRIELRRAGEAREGALVVTQLLVAAGALEVAVCFAR